MNKILFIGNITDGTGYSNASERLITAMDVVGLDVTYKNIRLSNKFIPLSPRIEEFSKKSAHDCDFVITNLLPNLYDYSGKFKRNIGIFSSETSRVPYLWERSLKLMDEIWVPNKQMKSMLKYIKKPVEILPFPLKERGVLNKVGMLRQLKQDNNQFIFLHVGEFNARKNYETLLVAYFTTFSMFDNTTLVLKTGIDGMDDKQSEQKVNELVNHIKSRLKLRYYPTIKILTGTYDSEFIDTLHAESDCFVSASHGESCCLPALDSIYLGTPIIVPNCTGFKDYADGRGIKISVTENVCYNTDNVWYDANQNWWNPDLEELKTAMYNMRYNVDGVYNRSKRFCENHKDTLIQNRGYTAIGNQIKTLLDI